MINSRTSEAQGSLTKGTELLRMSNIFQSLRSSRKTALGLGRHSSKDKGSKDAKWIQRSLCKVVCLPNMADRIKERTMRGGSCVIRLTLIVESL